ncbi:MAG: TIGR04076 family protein [Bacteroidales bacterium]
MKRCKITVLKTTLDKELFYYGDWIRKPGVAICSCNDGLRPVIFRVETTDEESTINYTSIK